MKKPNWNKSIDEVLFTKSEKTEMTSASGNQYVTEVIPAYDVVILGSATAKTDAANNVTGYVYEVYDPNHDLGGFTITTPNLIKFKGLKKVSFVRVRVGALSNKSEGRFKADKIELLK